MDQGISPATTPGATKRKRMLPSAARALCTGRGGLTGEPLDQLRQALRLVLRDEGVGVLDLLQLRPADGLGQALGKGELEEAVLDGPGQHRRPVEVAQLLGGLKGV